MTLKLNSDILKCAITGEDDQTLAGLVPSQSFQHQRESMRLAAEERMMKPQRKSSTLLCGKTAKRKKKKGTYAEGGYPMYTNAVDGKRHKFLINFIHSFVSTAEIVI